jgi:aminopeptidase N
MRTEDARPVRLQDYRPPDWLVEKVELDVALHPHETTVRAALSLRPNTKTGTPAPLVLDGDGLVLQSLKLDGETVPADHYVATPDQLTIPQPPNGSFVLEIETKLDPSANTQLMGLYRSNGTYCTQCEAEGFRRITYFPDRPDVMAVFTTRIEADRSEAPILLANGNLVSAGGISGGERHFAVWHDPFPKPSYLFALVGGRLGAISDTFKTMSGHEVLLKIYTEPGKESRATYAMDSLKRAMRWDEEVFGREYDLDIFMIVAVSDFNMGAMENKGLNIFNDKYVLASPETATDADYAGIEAVIAHEYFHNWTGNRITCRDWFQLCLKEGLTVFRDQEFTSDQRSRAVKRIADVRALRAHQFVEDSGPLAHPVRPESYREINNFYTATVYEKGAEVVRMLKTLLGPAGFSESMSLYFDRHDGTAATVEQFVQCFADAAGVDLTQFMRWYSQAGAPEVTIATQRDPAAKTLTLHVSQSTPPSPGQPEKKPFVVPLALGLVGEDGGDLPLRSADGRDLTSGVLTLREPGETVVFTGIDQKAVPSINRGFSAPIRLATDLSPDDLRFLAARDSDPFNRWQAVQTLATHLLTENARGHRQHKPMRHDEGLMTALGAIVADETLAPAFIAQCLMMPAEADVAREIGDDVDPDAIFLARKALRAAIGDRLGSALRDIYRQFNASVPYSPDAVSAGRRTLKNVCLDLIAASGTPAGVALAARQYHTADNMTDRFAALSTLSLRAAPERQAAFDDFYRRFESDHLVVDKWLGLQAIIPEPGTLDRVRALTQHAAFSLSNPNRVRALIGTFAHGNFTQFNRPDGEGYAFVADAILRLDPINPQVAARMMTAFRTWRSLESLRRHKAEAALRRVASAHSLSQDLKDIAERSLA